MKDEAEKPVVIIKLDNGDYKFFPLNLEAINTFLDYEQKRNKTKH